VSNLKLAFKRMGAELDIVDTDSRFGGRFSIDLRETKQGERFLISGRDIGKEDIKILDIEPKERHLLMMWNDQVTGTKHRFLAGHDERHWFVAAVPGDNVKNVTEAMEALKPEAVKERERMVGVKGEAKRQRWNKARKRQGEWFFVPVFHSLSKDKVVLKNEPINRGGGKPHMCEFLTRMGGTRVWVSERYPNGIDESTYRKLQKKQPEVKAWNWQLRVADAKVFVKGRVSHPDHATLDLGGDWHEVFMNRESDAPSMKHMRFLD
jgi:hypothetical protein